MTLEEQCDDLVARGLTIPIDYIIELTHQGVPTSQWHDHIDGFQVEEVPEEF